MPNLLSVPNKKSLLHIYFLKHTHFNINFMPRKSNLLFLINAYFPHYYTL